MKKKKVENIHAAAAFIRHFYGEPDVTWARIGVYGRRSNSATPDYYSTAQRFYNRDTSTGKWRDFTRWSEVAGYYKLRGFMLTQHLDCIKAVCLDFTVKDDPDVVYNAKSTDGKWRVNVIGKTTSPGAVSPKRSELVIQPEQTSPMSTGNVVARLAEEKEHTRCSEGTGKMPNLFSSVDDANSAHDADKTVKMEPLEFKTKIA